MDSFIREAIPFKTFAYFERYFRLVDQTRQRDKQILNRFKLHFTILAIQSTFFIYIYLFYGKSTTSWTLTQLIVGDYIHMLNLQPETYPLFGGICALSAYFFHLLYYHYDSIFLILLRNILIEQRNDFYIQQSSLSSALSNYNNDVDIVCYIRTYAMMWITIFQGFFVLMGECIFRVNSKEE